MASTGRRLLLILCLILALSIPGSAQLSFSSIPVIVQLSPLANINTVTSALNATVLDSIPGANTYLLKLPSGLPNGSLTSLLGIQWLEVNTAIWIPDIAVVGMVNLPGTPLADFYKNQPAWQLIEAQRAVSAGFTGTGVTVADINTAVKYHPALNGHLVAGYDFIANRSYGPSSVNQSSAGYVDQSSAGYIDQSSAGYIDQSAAGYIDQSAAGYVDQSSAGYIDSLGAVLGLPDLTVGPGYSHGTLCAGIIAAIAPNSMIMPLRAFDENGQSDLFTIAKAIRYAAQNGAQVINMSFGAPFSSKAMQSAVQYAQQRGATLVASAGNDNTSNPQYPAAYSGVLTAAATDLFDHKAAFSNYGSTIFVDAPGVNIISTYPGGSYGMVSGTSFSAPTVAATAALVRSVRTTGISSAIAGGSVNIDSQNPNYARQLGYGRIDVLRAVKPN